MLKKLSLHGFKSFCDRTDLTFGTGITAIVGPNGCGKSNIADALRWVLGEQNSRLLRCNKLEDLIFGGTHKRKSMGMAEVRLLIEGVIDEGELELTRRFTRDGSSEYRINNRTCRYKDVNELLLGTGLSHTGYVVIGQGTIQELAGGRPEDRRLWIEEASGVSKFRLSKREIEDRLSLASSDLIRLEDLLVELESRKASLYADWEIASKYYALLKERNDAELSMWLYQENEEFRQLQNVDRRMAKYAKELQEILHLSSHLESDVASLQREVESTETGLTLLKEHKENIEAQSFSLKKTKDEISGKLSLISKEIDARNLRRKSLESDLRNMASQEESLALKYEGVSLKRAEILNTLKTLQEEKESFDQMWKSLGGKVIDSRSQIGSLSEHLAVLDKKKRELEGQLLSIGAEMKEVNSKILTLKEAIGDLRNTRDKAEQELCQAIEEERGSKVLCESMEEKTEFLKASLESMSFLVRNLESQMSSATARKNVLQELESSFEGYGKGPRAILLAQKRGILDGIVGAVGETISCEERFIKALSSAAGGTTENIIVSDEDAAKSAIAYLKAQKAGRCTFLPLSVLKPRTLHRKAFSALSKISGVRPLISIVNCSEDLMVCAQHLFGNIVLAETIESGLAFMEESSWTARVVTLEGEIIDPGGAITGGEPPRHATLFLRKRELESLSHEISSRQLEISEKKAAATDLAEELSDYEKRLEEARANNILLASKISGLRKTVSDLTRAIDTSANEVLKAETNIEPLRLSKERLMLEIAEVEEEHQSLSMEIVSREQELSKYESQISGFLSSAESYPARIAQIEAEKEKLDREFASLLGQIESLKGQQMSTRNTLVDEEKEMLRLTQLKDGLIPEIASLEESIDAVEREKGDLDKEISVLQKDLASLTERLSKTLEELESNKKEYLYMQSRMSDAKTEKDGIEKSLGETRQMLLSRYGINSADDCNHPRINRQEALDRMQEIESQVMALGTVNLKAEKDYVELSDRIESVENEKTDIQTAMNELERTRDLIDAEIQARFMATFEQVDQNFQRIFGELFGGGRGRLNIVDENMGIEVIAEPPGRRHKQFNLLSGGERSLCGIALIFAVLSTSPSPLMVLDEVDSSLDDANVVRFAQFLRRYSDQTQFVVITHQESTMEVADVIYGVTMEEPGVSKVFGMRLQH